jgi:pyruvate dehydrogenase E2 component (dihydrolipoamide acetyltransferase)
MAQLVTLPAIVADATDAVIESWLVETGADISHGQALADIETEKATVELEAESSGTLARILVAAGTTVEVGAPIAVLAEPGDGEAEIDSLLAGVNAETTTSSTSGSGSSAEVEKDQPADEGLERSNASKVGTADAAAGAPIDTAEAAASDMTRVFASPLARRRARELGIDVTGLNGSGPGGRIIRSDVETAAEAADSGSASAPRSAQPSTAPAGDAAGTGYTDVPLTGMRRAIARRLTESKSTVPHFYLTGDIRMDALLDFRKQINVSLERQGIKATINDLVLKALGHALREVPEANAIWNESSIRTFDSVDISMAIATEGGLLTPVVRDVTNLSMAALCRTTQDLKVRAGEKAIRQQELEGGSFSLSNLGMFGTREFSAILNPPQAGILAVGATEQRAVVSDGELAVASMMTVTFSADHRVIDGAVAGRLLTSLRDALEDPMSLVL